MVTLSNPESGEVINSKLWLGHDLKIFLRLGHVGTPFPLELPLLKKINLENGAAPQLINQ